jgi:hypothetical protein
VFTTETPRGRGFEQEIAERTEGEGEPWRQGVFTEGNKGNQVERREVCSWRRHRGAEVLNNEFATGPSRTSQSGGTEFFTEGRQGNEEWGKGIVDRVCETGGRRENGGEMNSPQRHRGTEFFT